MLACAPERGARAALGEYRALRGALVLAETAYVGPRGRYAEYRVRLTSGTGLVATGRLLAPDRSARARGLPAVLLNDGRELNGGALDHLPREFGDVVVLSLDYPSELPYALDLGALVGRADRLRRAARRIPAAFSLGASYLASRADVDSTRLALTATSFAVPFAVIAAAADPRFRNVALIYGAGELADVVAANLELRPRFLRGAVAWLATRPFTEFEPERYVAAIAPRPIVMVNGDGDPQMPRAAVVALYRAAREPKTLIWLRTGHLVPSDTALIHALVDTALARLPVLHHGRRRRANGARVAVGDAARGAHGRGGTAPPVFIVQQDMGVDVADPTVHERTTWRPPSDRAASRAAAPTASTARARARASSVPCARRSTARSDAGSTATAGR